MHAPIGQRFFDKVEQVKNDHIVADAPHACHGVNNLLRLIVQVRNENDQPAPLPLRRLTQDTLFETRCAACLKTFERRKDHV